MIPELILYLLKVNIALLLFYCTYKFALEHLTFYIINRFYLLLAMVFSSVYPLIDLSILLKDNTELKQQVNNITPDWAGSITYVIGQTQDEIISQANYQKIIVLFWAGVLFMFLKFILQLISLWQIHLQSISDSWQDFAFRKTKKLIHPFSFWRTVYLNPDCHQKEELKSILEHEIVHIRQFHTFDVILAELSTIFYWFNPGVWMIKKSVKHNLEYLTDHQVIQAGIDRKAYQYALLNSLTLSQNWSLVNNFYFLTIKKRIIMMNKKPSNRINLGRYLLLIPGIVILIFLATVSKASFSTESVKQLIINLRTTHNLPVAIHSLPTIHSLSKQAKLKSQSFDNSINNSSILRDTPKVQIMDLINVLSHKIDTSKNLTMNLSGTGNALTQSKAIYYLDGKRAPVGINVNSEYIHSISIYKSPESQRIFGSEGVNGVVNIITKENAHDPQVIEFQKSISIGDVGVNQQAYKSKIPNNLIVLDGNNLIVLDGKEITQTDLKNLSKSSIEEIHVLKGQSALLKYGEKGRNGVIEIKSKQ